MFKTFLTALAFLGAIIGQIYLCTYTEFPKILCYIPAFIVAPLAGYAASGGGKLVGKPNKVLGKDDQDNLFVSRFWGVSALMFLVFQVFTIIALSER